MWCWKPRQAHGGVGYQTRSRLPTASFFSFFLPPCLSFPFSPFLRPSLSFLPLSLLPRFTSLSPFEEASSHLGECVTSSNAPRITINYLSVASSHLLALSTILPAFNAMQVYTLSSFRTDSASSRSLVQFDETSLYVREDILILADFDESKREGKRYFSLRWMYISLLFPENLSFRENLSNRSGVARRKKGGSPVPYFHPSSIGNAIISMKNKFQWDTPVGRDKVEVEKIFFASYREISDLLIPPLSRIQE